MNYTSNIGESILYFLSNKISFLLTPIGLNNAGIVCGLIVGVLAKELIVSTFSLTNLKKDVIITIQDVSSCDLILLISQLAVNVKSGTGHVRNRNSHVRKNVYM